MRWTQRKEVNKNPEVAGSNPVKNKNNYIFLLTFFFIHLYNFVLLSLGLC